MLSLVLAAAPGLSLSVYVCVQHSCNVTEKQVQGEVTSPHPSPPTPVGLFATLGVQMGYSMD